MTGVICCGDVPCGLCGGHAGCELELAHPGCCAGLCESCRAQADREALCIAWGRPDEGVQ